jgi:hypothetical protein
VIRDQGGPAALAAVACAVALLSAGCASVTSGQGTAGSPSVSSSHRPDFPSSSVSVQVPTTSNLPATPASSPSAPQTPAERQAKLDAQTNGAASVLVRVPGGFQAASYDQRGNIHFWAESMSDTTWREIGHSRYPNVPQLGPPHASVRGALLRNMSDATFIVHGNFTGDGSGNAVAFSNGRRGWGAIKAQPNGNIAPSGRPVGANLIGLGYDFAFKRGYLETKDCSPDRPLSECGAHPIVKYWVWRGGEFVRT